MTIKITSEQELEEVAAKLFHILYNLRWWEKELKEHGGFALRTTVKEWQQRADDLMDKYKMKREYRTEQVKIEINVIERS